MKCTTIIDQNREEEVLIYLHEKNKLATEIEELVLGRSLALIGYQDKNILRISVSDVCCFFIEDNKVYALTEKEKIHIKQRLYTLEENLDDTFVKINQSCIANIRKIERFDTSFAGALLVIFKNGHRDYVSRRQVKIVKERLGI